MKKLFFFIISLFIVQVSNAQLLWKISGNGLKQDSYLYGTIHVMPKKDFKVSDKIKEIFKSCSVLAMEVDLNMKLSEQIEIAKEMILPNNQSIKDIMTEGDYQKLKTYCLDTLKIKEKKFTKYERLKPFFLSSVLLQEQLGKTKSYEQEFNKMAKKNKMQILGLETIQVQLETINTVSIEEQTKQLMESYNASMEQFDEMVKLYMENNLEKLYEMVISESDEEFNKNFLEKRNKSWIPVIEPLIKDNSVFIAVGAAHLSGETGVIQLLKNQGYTLEPVL